MPRRGRARGGRRGNPHGEVEIQHGRYYAIVTTVVSGSSQQGLALRPAALDARLVSMNDFYRLFRFTRCCLHFCQADGGFGWAAYANGGTFTNPTTVALASQMDYFASAFPGQTTTVSLNLGRRDLRGIPSWYQTEAVGDPELDTQGTFIIGAGSATTGLAIAATLLIRLDYTVEFKERLPASVSNEREKRRLDSPEILQPIRQIGQEPVQWVRRIGAVDAVYSTNPEPPEPPPTGEGGIAACSSRRVLQARR